MAEATRQTIAITGATGFVGSRLLDLATGTDFHIRALTRRPQEDRPNVTWVHGALDKKDSLSELCTDAQAVIHIAGVVNAPTKQGFEAGNIAGTSAIVDAATKHAVKRFVHVSSLAATLPKLSIYGETKSKAEDIVAASQLDWTIIRPPAVYGPGDGEMLELFKMAKWGFVALPPDADGRLSVIHVDDLCRALLAVTSDNETLSGQTCELDDGQENGWTQADFARAIGESIGKRVKPIGIPKALLNLGAAADKFVRRDKAKLTSDRVSYFCHDDWTIDPAKRLPTQIWEPKIETCKGLKDTAKWYRQNDWL